MPELNILSSAGGKAAALDDEICSFLKSAPYPAIDGTVGNDDAIRQVHSIVKPLRGSHIEAALWLVVGELDRSHDVSQKDGSAEGSYWHGIMHRREGDFSNAKYWFQRVGTHDVFEQLAYWITEEKDNFSATFPTDKLTDPNTLPFNLVDCCESAGRSKRAWTKDLEKIGWSEWQLLLQHCL